MNQSKLWKAIPIALGTAGIASLLFLFWMIFQSPLKERLPGQDRSGVGPGITNAPTKWEGKLLKSHGVPANLAGAWPRFRGTNLDNICTDPTPLARTWPESGPKELWKIEVGEGFAGAAIWKGRVFLMDYDRELAADAVRCLSLENGEEIWRYTYPVKVKRNHGMTRTIPTVTDQGVISLGPKCQVTCVDPVSGELRWELNLVREFNAEVPPWYAGQCPLVDQGKVILATGGDVLMVAVTLETGKVIWKTPNRKRWQMTHSTPMPIEVKGKRQYVYCASGGVAGVAAEDGALLWDTPDWKISIANVPTPVPIDGERLFLSGGYNAGSMMLGVKETNGTWTAESLFRLKPTVFGATQQTPILYQNHLFGIRPDGQLVCLDLNGKSVWESGPRNRFGSGPFLLAQDMVYLLNDEGTLTLAEASTMGYQQLAQAKILPGPDSWGPLALADGRLIARDVTTLVCLDVRRK